MNVGSNSASASKKQDPKKLLALPKATIGRRPDFDMPRKLPTLPNSTNIIDYPNTMSMYERESLAAEAKLDAEKKLKKRQKQRDRAAKRKGI